MSPESWFMAAVVALACAGVVWLTHGPRGEW